MPLGRGLVESVYHSALRLNANKVTLTATVVKHPVVELLADCVIIVADNGFVTAREIIAVYVYVLRGTSRNVALLLRVKMLVSAVCLTVDSFLMHRNGENKEVGLDKGAVHTEHDGEVALVDIFDRVALGKSSLVKCVGYPNLAHKGEPLVYFIVDVLESYLVFFMLNELEGASVYKSVNVALRPILVERKGVFVTLKGEFCKIGAVSGEKNGRALKIGVDSKLSLVNKRNEDVLTAMCKRYNVSAESGAYESRPVAVLNG